MNVRMKRLKRFYLSIPTAVAPEFTYYANSATSNTVTTEYYYGTKAIVKVPSSLDGFPVTEIGSTTFSTGAFKTDVLDKPDNTQDITSVNISEGITKI